MKYQVMANLGNDLFVSFGTHRFYLVALFNKLVNNGMADVESIHIIKHKG